MSLSPNQRDSHPHEKAEKTRLILKEIIELKEQLNQLPESYCFDRYPHLHNRMDHLINTYMQLLNSRNH